jgi:hypothetical protein
MQTIGVIRPFDVKKDYNRINLESAKLRVFRASIQWPLRWLMQSLAYLGYDDRTSTFERVRHRLS